MSLLMRVRPLEFPAAAGEISRDLEAIAATFAPEPEDGDDRFEATENEEAVADLENRLRAGTE